MPGDLQGLIFLPDLASFDPEIAKWLKEVTDYEQEQIGKDKILAEIIHIPDILSGNLLARPNLRNYEIPYLAKSNLLPTNQIKLDDLLVSVSLSENRLILRSRKLQKEIVPILSNVHNYKISAHPIYGFLAALQFQHYQDRVQFDWGPLKHFYQVFPRIYYKNMIISRATWHLNKPDFEKLNQLQQLETWKDKWRLPDQFLLAERDNEMLIDFKNTLSKKGFLKLIKNKKKITLKEFIFDPKTCPIRDVHGKAYTNEFVAIILNEDKPKANRERLFFRPTLPHSKIIREFNFGSEWLYYKIYCGVEFADTLLSNHIGTVLQKNQQLGVLDKWFFIRYSDPDFHLRLRASFQGTFLFRCFFNRINKCLTKPFRGKTDLENPNGHLSKRAGAVWVRNH